MNIWIVGNKTGTGLEWEFVGAFSSEDGALAVCRGNPTYFIGPIMLDQVAPSEPTPWPGAYLPAIDRAIEGAT